MRIAINGFGRIGRTFLRTVLHDVRAEKELEIVVINVGPADPHKVAHMFQYDSLMRTFNGTVSYENNILYVNQHRIAIIAVTDVNQLNWKQYNIDWVVDATGRFTSQELAEFHIKAGAKHVLITAPCKGTVTTIVPGVNQHLFDLVRDKVVSLASCTTNAVTPMLKVMQDQYGVEAGSMTTVHAYTNSQVLLDVESDDLRRSRAAALNIIPTSTGASRMIDQVIPELAGRICSSAIRVPVALVSIIDLVLVIKQKTTINAINESFMHASHNELKGILQVGLQPLVSSDYIGSDASVTIDAALTQLQGNMVKLFGWYDNEWGYSSRLRDFLLCVSVSR